MAGKPGRAGAVRKQGKNKAVGSGGQGRQALEGKGPTPKATQRDWHPAGKRKIHMDKLAATRKLRGPGAAPSADGSVRKPQVRRPKQADEAEIVTGRNSVVEALRAEIPATALYISNRIEMDDRVKEVLNIATKRGLPIMEVMRP